MIASEKAETEFTIYLLLRSKLNSDSHRNKSQTIESNQIKV